MEIQVNGIRLWVEEQGDGLPLVLIHGFPLNNSIWDPLLPYLTGHLRIIRPDLRGFGKSEVTQGVYSMRMLAEDMAGVLDVLKIPQAILVGHSMGGYVSLAFAQAYPDRLLGLGMVSSQAAGDSAEKRSGRIAIAEKVLKEGSGFFADINAPQLTAVPSLQEKLHQIIQATDPIAIAAAQKGMAERIDMIPYLPEITVPAVIIHGSADQLIPVECAHETAGGLPRGLLFEIPNVYHMPMMETPKQSSEPINQMCAEVVNLHPEFL